MGYARDFIGAHGADAARRRRARRPGHRQRRRREPARVRRGGARRSRASAGCRGRLRVGVVTGDDILDRTRRAASPRGHALHEHGDRASRSSDVRDRVLSANAYIGSAPIVEALARGANVVITGRSTDTGAHAWRRSATSSAGRATTGTSSPPGSSRATSSSAARSARAATACTTGATIPDLANVGYPIVEARADGTFVVTKHPGTGGRISVPSVTEQLVYEMGDPQQLHHARRASPTSPRSSSRHDGPRTACACSASAGAPRDRQAQGVDRLSRRLQGRRHAGVRLARRAREGAGRRPRAPRAARPTGPLASTRSSPSSSA